MKKLLQLLFVFAMTATMVSCSDDADPITEPEETTLSGVLSEDKTLTADEIWTISGRYIVDAGATLTIQAGTIIKGASGEGTNAAVLMVARGGMINAVGTASNPIIMTTVLDDIQVGQLEGTNLGNPGDKGKWGGLVILGSAPISVDGATEAQIEGVPASESLGLYGGSDASDNSGTVKYVSIRYGGAVIDATGGKEINGLTLGGVGTGTTIDHIEIFANVDDGVEFFGGTVNVSDVLVSYQGDDALDIDQAYAGTVDNFYLIQDTNSDKGLEVDGPEGAENADGMFTLMDGTIMSVDGSGGGAADFKSKAQGTVTNVLWEGYDDAIIKLRASYQNECADAKSDAFTNLTDQPATLSFTSVVFDAVNVYTATDGCEVPAADQTAAEGLIVSDSSTGAADASAWDGWTLSSLREDI
ncbi:MAG: hypothetical protein JXR07_16340 [Reichenbachiella sp.]